MKRIYVVNRLEVNDYVPSIETLVFATLESAKKQFEAEIESVKAENLQDIHDGITEESDHSFYTCYIMGRATELTIEISIAEHTIKD